MPAFDPAALRADFPILSREVEGKPLVYLDNGATSQKPRAVVEAVARFLSEDNANIHRGIHTLSRLATDAYDEVRVRVKKDLNAGAEREAVFVRGTTEAVNLVASGLADRLGEGDEIVLTIMEHHANIVPWQVLAERRGLKLHFAGITPSGELDLDDWKSRFNARTRVAAFTHVSNALGTVNPVAAMAAHAREHGALSFVDGAQALPHGPVDLEAMDPDFYAFSGHKMFGPDGIGVLCGRTGLLNSLPPYQTGGDMIERVTVEGTTFREAPERFEAGTPNISATIGLGEAFRYLEGVDRAAATAHEEALAAHAAGELLKIPGVRLFGEAPGKAAIVSFLYEEAHPHDVGTILDSEGVAIRVGHHCAQPLMDHFGVPGTARASFAMYNTHEDVEAFLSAMRKVVRFFGPRP